MGSQQKELAAFKEGLLDVIFHLPPESVKEEVVDNITAFRDTPVKYMLERSPEMSTQYYDLISHRGAFTNKKVRQAFSYAIDRNKITEQILNGEGNPGIYGITPPLFKDYNDTSLKGYNLDVIKAKKLLAEAGYPDGKGFPKVTLELNSGGSRHVITALEIQKELKKNLNVDIDFNIVSFPQKLEDAKYAKADMFRSSWVADYPNPESFLSVFYGKTVPTSINEPSFPNIARYRNAAFDKLYESGMQANSKDEAYKLFLEAEKIAIEDAPVIVLWYDDNYRMLQARVRNFPVCPVQQYRNFSAVYFDEPVRAPE